MNTDEKKFPPPMINVHCHFMTFDHLPDRYTKKLFKLTKGIPVEIPERILKKIGGFPLKLPFWVPGFSLLQAFKDKLTWRFNHFPSDRGAIEGYMKKGEYRVLIKKLPPSAGVHSGEFFDGINKKYRARYPETPTSCPYDIVVPLMMDMISASQVNKPGVNTGVIPWDIQIERYSRCIRKYPFRVFPFIMFNPVRENSYELVADAVRRQGFIGIKLYPAMGFYPEPEKNTFNNCHLSRNCKQRHLCRRLKKSFCCERLEQLYRFADARSLPITVHAGYDSMQNIDVSANEAAEYTDIMGFENVLKNYPRIRINFAHFGGTEYIVNFHKKDKKNRKGSSFKYSLKWRNQILQLMNEFNSEHCTRVFADVAANSLTCTSAVTKGHYFSDLYELFKKKPYKKGILFGTDTPAISVLKSDKRFRRLYLRGVKNAYEDDISEDKPLIDEVLKDFFYENSLDFLFGPEREIPVSYINFLSAHVEEKFRLPPWVEGVEKGRLNRFFRQLLKD